MTPCIVFGVADLGDWTSRDKGEWSSECNQKNQYLYRCAINLTNLKRGGRLSILKLILDNMLFVQQPPTHSLYLPDPSGFVIFILIVGIEKPPKVIHR